MISNILNPKNVSLALGSGSAKGVAHISIIEEFLNAGYNIRAISGCSMGAIVASYYALGKLGDLKSWFLGMQKHDTFMKMDFSLTGGLMSGKRIMASFEEHLGEARIEDASIPLYIVATNLDSGERTIFKSGPVLDAIRASIGVPGVLKPYYYEGAYYVDGAVSDPVPVDILIEEGYGNIIAVHLNRYLEERETKSAPSVLSTMSRSMSLVSKFLADAKMDGARAVIAPELSDFGMFELHRSADILEVGRKAARQLIDSNLLKPGIKEIFKIFTGK